MPEVCFVIEDVWVESNRKPNSHWFKKEGSSLIPYLEIQLYAQLWGLLHPGALAHFSKTPSILPCSLCWLHYQVGLLFGSKITIAGSPLCLHPTSSGVRRMHHSRLPSQSPEKHLDCPCLGDMPAP